jgi:predicted DNA binding protein
MTVIAQLRIPASSFELGRILPLERGASIELESLIPLGEKAVPFFFVENKRRDDFQAGIENHPSVESIHLVNEHENKSLYSLDWNVSRDLFFQGVVKTKAHILNARGVGETWAFELRFPDHARLSQFQDFCENAHISLEVDRIYNPTRPDAGMWYGLTEPQRDTLVRAVQGGYYSIPRRMSTKDLAGELSISDQAVTERLRRAIVSLVENTLIAEIEANGGADELF